jgi:hypothetical protein
MATIVRQGILAVGSNVIFTGFDSKNYITESIMLNNSSAYTIQIKRFDHLANTTTTLCSLTLDPGDTIFDTTKYPINQRDRLIIDSPIAGTNYLLTISEI